MCVQCPARHLLSVMWREGIWAPGRREAELLSSRNRFTNLEEKKAWKAQTMLMLGWIFSLVGFGLGKEILGEEIDLKRAEKITFSCGAQHVPWL